MMPSSWGNWTFGFTLLRVPAGWANVAPSAYPNKLLDWDLLHLEIAGFILLGGALLLAVVLTIFLGDRSTGRSWPSRPPANPRPDSPPLAGEENAKETPPG